MSPSYEPPPPAAFSRPLGVVLLAVLNGLGALLYLGFGFLLVVGAAAAEGDAAEAGPVLAVIGAVVAIFGAVHMATAVGLFLLKGFGRVLQIIQSALGLLAIPIGTIISAIVLYYMTRPGMALLFSGRAPASMTLEERQTVERDANKGGIVVVIVVVMALLAVPVMGIIAAIAIPGLLRARMSGNEAMAIGRMRGMSSGQAAYSSTHDGRYGTLACLTNPSSCPGEPVDTPYVSGDTEPDGTRSGYRYQLYVPEDGSRYTYFAEPVTPGTTGTRSFCIDQTGTVMEYLEPGAVTAPSTSDAPCPDGGRPVM